MTNLFFNFENSDGSISKGVLYISPTMTPFAYSGSIIISDTSVVKVVTNPTIVYNVIPSTYKIKVATDKIQTEFNILVPELNGGSVDASTLIII